MAPINFVAKLNHWRNKSQGAPETVLFAEDLNRYEKLGSDVSELVDDGRLSETALNNTYAPIGSVGGGSGLTDDGTGLFTISSGSSITEDSSNPGLYLIGA